MKFVLLTLMCFVLALVGCQSQTTRNIDMVNDQGKAVMGLDYRDFQQAAAAMVGSLIRSGTLQKKDGSRYVMATGRVVNKTMEWLDTSQLMAKIEEELLNSGLVVMTSAVAIKKGDTDQMIYKVRELRDSDVGDEFHQDTLQGKGQLIAPELSISGKIMQRYVKYDGNQQQLEYYFQLRVVDLTTGLRFWQNEHIIGKRGPK